MGDAEALLRTIIARPADDAPRLIYADWLDENGDARRADYIRVMVRDRPTGILCRVMLEPDEYADGYISMRPAWTIRGKHPLCLADHTSTIAMLPPPEWCGRGAEAGVKRGFVTRYVGGSWMWAKGVSQTFAWHPLRAVRFSDLIAAFGPVGYCWLSSAYLAGTGPATVPDGLYDLLTGGADLDGLRLYPSREGCNVALSRAAIRFARIAAGFHPAPRRSDAAAHAAATPA